MPLYDCGDKDCDECQRAFGRTNREAAIKRFEAREFYYATLPQPSTVRTPAVVGGEKL